MSYYIIFYPIISYYIIYTSFTPPIHRIYMSYTSHIHLIYNSFTSHMHLIYISYTSQKHFVCIPKTSHTHLIYISSTSHLHLIYISCTSRLHLKDISYTSHKHLICISFTSYIHLIYISYVHILFVLYTYVNIMCLPAPCSIVLSCEVFWHFPSLTPGALPWQPPSLWTLMTLPGAGWGSKCKKSGGCISWFLRSSPHDIVHHLIWRFSRNLKQTLLGYCVHLCPLYWFHNVACTCGKRIFRHSCATYHQADRQKQMKCTNRQMREQNKGYMIYQ